MKTTDPFGFPPRCDDLFALEPLLWEQNRHLMVYDFWALGVGMLAWLIEAKGLSIVLYAQRTELYPCLTPNELREWCPPAEAAISTLTRDLSIEDARAVVTAAITERLTGEPVNLRGKVCRWSEDSVPSGDATEMADNLQRLDRRGVPSPPFSAARRYIAHQLGFGRKQSIYHGDYQREAFVLQHIKKVFPGLLELAARRRLQAEGLMPTA